MIASGKSARIVNGGNGVGSAQSAKRLRVGHRGHHGTRLKAGNASQRRKTSPVRQQRTFASRKGSLTWGRERNAGSLAADASKPTLTVVTRATAHAGARRSCY